MNHSAEIKVHRYLEDVRNNKRGMLDSTIARIIKDVGDAMNKQFNSEERVFTLRMSNIGRPYCQLWFEKNRPEDGVDPPANFLMNMIIGDIVEAVFKGVLTEAGVDFSDGFTSSLKLDGTEIHGTHDLILDKKVDDIKSASPWSYKNKFVNYQTLKEHDAFGYVGQLAGYSKALGVDVGGWWVINKATGEYKYISAFDMAVERETILKDISKKIKELKSNKFRRCFSAVPETFRKKETGNKILDTSCSWCRFRYKCWPSLIERPSIPSSAKEPPVVGYVEIADEYKEKASA